MLSIMCVCVDHPESSRSVPECTAAAETLMEARLRDLLLDLEDRIHQGTLGTLKVTHAHANTHTHVYLCVCVTHLSVCPGDGQTGLALSAGGGKLPAAVC